MLRKPRATVVGVFADHRKAGNAVDELRQAGFRDDQIAITPSHRAGDLAAEGKAESPRRAPTFRALVGFVKSVLDPAEEVYDAEHERWVPQTTVRVQGGRRADEAIGILQDSGGYIQ